MERNEKEDEKNDSKPQTSHDSSGEKRDDQDTPSRSSGSCSSMEVMDRANMKNDAPVPHLGTKKMRVEKKRRPKRPLGRVEKRKKMTKKAKRRPKPKLGGTRVPSVSTLYSQRSETPELKYHGCKYCGHRCCQRRFEYELRLLETGYHKKGNKPRPIVRRLEKVALGSKNIQIGSRCAMLSPLFMGCSTSAGNPPVLEEARQCEISPQMIHQCLKELTMWRQGVPRSSILEYIKASYPVNPNAEELETELSEKLHVASIIGIVWELPDDCWRLTTALERVHKLDNSHVTVFWKVYGDTMKPLRRNFKLVLQPKPASKKIETEKASEPNKDDYPEDDIM